MYVYRVLDDIESKVIGCSMNMAGFDTAPCQKHREGFVVVVSAVSFFALSHWRTTKFSAPDNQCIFKHVSVFQVLKQCGKGLVGFQAIFPQACILTTMGVPGFVKELNKSDTAFQESAAQ
jgi:hypothetical protein